MELTDSKNTQQVRSLNFIFDNVEHQKYELIDYIQAKDENEILKKIRIITSEIYSGCEIINEILITVYRQRFRGSQLKNGFNDNFKRVYNIFTKRERNIPAIYGDPFISSFYLSAKSWFVDIHDIRTQETHYEVGRIQNEEEELLYLNNNRNGTSKQIYTNPSTQIKLKLMDFITLVDGFLRTKIVIFDFLNNEDR